MGRTVVSRYRPSAAPSIAVLIAYSRNAQGYSKFLASVRHSEPSLTHASDPAPIHDSKPTPTHATKSSPGASCQTHPVAAIAAHATSTPGTGLPTHPLRKQSLKSPRKRPRRCNRADAREQYSSNPTRWPTMAKRIGRQILCACRQRVHFLAFSSCTSRSDPD